MRADLCAPFARTSSPSRFAARSDVAFIDEAGQVAFKEPPFPGQSAKMARFAAKRCLFAPRLIAGTCSPEQRLTIAPGRPSNALAKNAMNRHS